METTAKNKSGTIYPDRDTQNEIVIERVLNLPVSKVWKAWSEPESLKKWWGPKDFTCPSSNITFKKGGKYLNCMRSPDGEEFWSTGVYEEIIPRKKIVFTDSFADSKGNTISASEHNMPGDWPIELLITVNLEEVNGKTVLTLQHQGIPDEMYEDCIQGWNESFDKLEKNLK
ncbi:MAG: SRPBCC domain-containing protein [Chitinophagaceae bacterium]